MNEKPLIIERYEFAEHIVKTINETNLPAFVMLDVIKDVEESLSRLTIQQLEEAKAAYKPQEVENEDK